MPAEARHLADLVAVRGRFVRSVHIERDARTSLAGGYLLLESGFQALRAVDSALERPSERALTVIGPYGAGKSAFCLYLSQLIASSDANVPAAGLEDERSREVADRLRAAGPLLPALITGSRQPMARALVEGLERALVQSGFRKLLRQLRKEFAAVWDTAVPAPRQVADLFVRASTLTDLENRRGLLLVVDEMGKLLEYAALHPEQGDFFVLQELAEGAARSGDHPLLVITVLHQNPEAYAQRVGRSHQAEWAKVGERFRQVPFFPSDLERITLLGRALEQKPELNLDGSADRLTRLSLDTGIVPSALRDRFAPSLREAYPLHPVALLALPALFRRAGQSHRSLFNFLSGEEPHALGRFLRETPYDPTRPPLFMPESLFDYAAEALLAGWTGSDLAYLWGEAVDLVDRAIHVSELARQVLKCIALLSLLRDPRLKPSQEVLALALTDGNSRPLDVAGALEELQQRRLIAYSRMQEAYRLWEGGDVDVGAALEAARGSLPAGVILHVGTELCPPPTLVARRHSYETGVIRQVPAHPCSPAQMETLLARIGGSLGVMFCLAPNAEEARRAERIARDTSRPNLLYGIATETEVLRETAADVAAAHQVVKDTPALQGDRAARRELSARREEAEMAFRAEWERLFGPGSGGARWIYCGARTEVPGARAFSTLLSQMADATYSAAPILRNELVNRETLSSAAAAARRNLTEAMLLKADTERLGITLFPPEASMYECILRATGLHREVEPGQWGFAVPAMEDPAGLRPCWQAVERFVYADPPEPRPIPELYKLLKGPPYGLTEGVLPVLVCAFLLANANETTLYREGTFLPEPAVADLEVLLRRPDMFAIAGGRVTGERRAVVERLARGLNVEPAVVPIVRALLRMVRGLPDYAWRTRRLSPRVLAVRSAFERARSPERLLFYELPFALETVGFAEQPVDGGTVEAFFGALNAALREWSETLPNLMAEARRLLLEACGLPGDDEGWSALRERAARLEPIVTHPTLLPFVRVAAQTGDDRTVLEALLAQQAGRPVRSWTDMDVERFPAQARLVGELFQWAATWNAVPTVAPVALEPEELQQCRQITEELRRGLAEHPPRVVRAALTAVLAELGHGPENGDTPDEQG